MKHIGLTLLILFAGHVPTSVVYAQATPKMVAAAPAPKGSSNQPPVLTRVSFIQTMDAEFKSRDANSDGRVSRAEVEEFERKSALRKSQLNNSALFLRLDADKNGSITATEFQKLITSPVLPDISSIMQRFDKNRDQQITIIEYRTTTLLRFDDLDVDKDGIVDQSELSAANNKEKNLEKSR